LIPSDKKAAFTLLETAIALLILAVVITSLLLSFYRCLSILQTSRDINIALSDLRGAYEEIRDDIDNARSLQYTQPQTFPHINNEQVAVTANTGQNPVPVNIAVSWQEQSLRQRTVIMDTLLTTRRR
jgi:type II secretory pathway pseudopilin PulG